MPEPRVSVNAALLVWLLLVSAIWAVLGYGLAWLYRVVNP